MCGFVAIRLHKEASVNQQSVKNATRSIQHRGPDDEGFYVDQNVGLGFRRLSILDLSLQSHQPFEDIDGRFIIIFNGEIYNYLELREELRAKGHSFRTNGDTEVLLTAFKEWGHTCVDRLNGMWAFIVYDKRSKSLFGSRDRFGIKPLYTANTGEAHIFGSEIKAVFATGLLSRDLNWTTATSYLFDGSASSAAYNNETFFHKIREVPAGHNFLLDRDGHYRCWRFWNIDTKETTSNCAPAERLINLLRDSVKLRLRSDVPVGVCLSGGLDSTAIICLMSEELGDDRSQPLNAFSFIDERFDETKEIQSTIAATNASLHRLSGNAESFFHHLKQVLWFHDEPFHSLNVLVSYELYRMAAESGVKVILNGQGADECWAGYPSYFDNYWYSLLGQSKILRLRKEIRAFSRMHQTPEATSWRRILNMFIRNQLRRATTYRRFAAKRARRRVLRHRWFTDDVFSKYPDNTPDYENLNLKAKLRRSIETQPLPLYLRVEDRNSMAHSIETRLPFLDYRIVEMSSGTEEGSLLNGGWNKFALRQALKGLIPEIVRTRPDKMGFPVSAKEWFAGPMYDMVRDTIESKKTREHGCFHTDIILKDLERHRRGQIDCSGDLLKVLQLQLVIEGQ